jgi:perosamine synthetase
MSTKLAKAIPRAIYYLSPKRAIKSFFQVATSPFTYDNVSEFEKSFALFVGSHDTISTSHARVALYSILKSLSLKEGSEIIMSGVNLPDMINMIKLNGLVPRVFDYEEKSFNFSIDDLKNKCTPMTKVLFLTVLAGISSNIEDVLEVASQLNLVVIIDQTQSMGIKIKKIPLASLCDFSIYSLCDLKDIHTHRGGIIAFNDISRRNSLRKTVDLISLNAQKKYFLSFIFEDFLSAILLRRNFFNLFISPILYFLHLIGKANILEDLTKGKGIKIGKINLGRGLWGGDGDIIRTSIPSELLYRFTTLQANLGLEQLRKVHLIQKERILRALLISKSLSFHDQLIDLSKDHIFWKFPLWVNDPKNIQRKLQLRGIDCAPTNLPSLCSIEAFRSFLLDETPQTKKLVTNVLFIPVHYYLTYDEVIKMGIIINEVLNEEKP